MHDCPCSFPRPFLRFSIILCYPFRGPARVNMTVFPLSFLNQLWLSFQLFLYYLLVLWATLFFLSIFLAVTHPLFSHFLHSTVSSVVHGPVNFNISIFYRLQLTAFHAWLLLLHLQLPVWSSLLSVGTFRSRHSKRWEFSLAFSFVYNYLSLSFLCKCVHVCPL